jgi:hypothetical protein
VMDDVAGMICPWPYLQRLGGAARTAGHQALVAGAPHVLGEPRLARRHPGFLTLVHLFVMDALGGGFIDSLIRQDGSG